MNKQVLIIGILWVIGLGLHAANSVSLAQQERSEDTASIPIETFVKRNFVDSLPFEEIKKYGTDDRRTDSVNTLLEMLEKDCTPFCSNILTMLSIIGDDDTREKTITLLSTGKKSLSLRAEADALMTFGFWINNTENKTGENNGRIFSTSRQAISELLRANKPKSGVTNIVNCLVNEIQVGKSGCFGEDLELRAYSPRQKLVRHRAAITGLALTGSEDIQFPVAINGKKDKMTVKDYLEFLLENEEVGTSERAHIIEALEAHNRIAGPGGLACYYEKRSSECQKNLQKLTGEKQ